MSANNPSVEFYDGPEPGDFIDQPDLVQRTPWWVISIVFHSAFLIMAAMWVVSNFKENTSPEIEFRPLPPRVNETYRPDAKRDIRRSEAKIKHEVLVKDPIVTKEDLPIEELQTPDEIEKELKAKGLEEAVSTLDFGGKGFFWNFGVGGGKPGQRGWRDGAGKKRAIGRFGGSEETELGVLAALRWFKRHQAGDGSWSMENYSKECKDAPPCEAGNIRCSSSGMDGGGWSEKNCATGFALLCYLGAGHTNKAGRFKQQVANGLSFLQKSQKEDGSFSNNNYCHAIATMAAAEAYWFTGSRLLKEMAQKAVDVTLARQNEYLGWNYQGPNARNDTSVTGWQVMAIKSAHGAKLNVGNAFEGVINHMNKVTPEVQGGSYPMLTGDVAYTYNSNTGALGHRNNRLTAIGLLSRVFAGEDTKSDMLRAHGNMILKKLPAQSNNMDFYRWYYATLAMFQMGGEYWKEWNKAMKDTFCDTQKKVGCADGSWDPNVSFGNRGGRVFATAVGCLSLEIYYRYLPVSMMKKQ
jgi:hypothetical protein